MNRAKFLGVLVFGVVAVAFAEITFGQAPHGPNYLPSAIRRPTLSPWLDLFRDDTGVLPNYHQFVRPQQRLRGYLGQQYRHMQREATQLRNVENQMSEMMRPSGARPTGTGA